MQQFLKNRRSLHSLAAAPTAPTASFRIMRRRRGSARAAGVASRRWCRDSWEDSLARQRERAGERVCGGMNKNHLGGEVVPRPVKQATAMKTPLESPDFPCISGKFSLVRDYTTGELLIRNHRGTSPPLRGWSREGLQGSRLRGRIEEGPVGGKAAYNGARFAPLRLGAYEPREQGGA